MRSTLKLVMSALVLASVVACGDTPITLSTPDGPVAGVQRGNTRSFFGLPFAAPPVGALRFAPPVPPTAWTATRDATALPPACAQVRLADRVSDPDASEDCLYLNVWAPAGVGPFPVMIFLPGGAYVIGSASDPTVAGERLSDEGGVIVVVANYRLGALGFLAHSAFATEEGRSTGDFGMLDQRAALTWVQKNIGAFGGDPSNVTMFGQSAGAGSACVQLVSPGSAGLFHKVILESPLCTGVVLPTRAEAEAQADSFAAALGCTGSDAEIRTCLRAKSTAEIVEGLPLNKNLLFGEGVAWQPIVDGVTLTDQPAALLAAGVSRDIPMIVGSNADEGSLFFFKDGIVNSDADYLAMLIDVFGPVRAEAVARVFPSDSNPQESAKRLVSELWTCDARRIARLHQGAGGTAYHYYFTRETYNVFTGLGAVHGGELPFVFGTTLAGIPILPAGIPLTRSMQAYWSTFARTGVPNDGREAWHPYDPAIDESLRFDLEVSHIRGVRSAVCDQWDSLLR